MKRIFSTLLVALLALGCTDPGEQMGAVRSGLKLDELQAPANAATFRSSIGLAIGTDVAAQTHATQHKSGGTDAIKLDELAAPTDVTTLNASASAHGLLPKLSGTASEMLGGDGAWRSLLAARVSAFGTLGGLTPTHLWRASSVVESGGLVDTITDAGSGALNFTSSGTNRCARAQDGAGKWYFTPDGVDDYYTAGTTSSFNFLHDGSPALVWIVFHAADTTVTSTTRTFFSTAGSSSHIGCLFGLNADGTYRGPGAYIYRASVGNVAMGMVDRKAARNAVQYMIYWTSGVQQGGIQTGTTGNTHAARLVSTGVDVLSATWTSPSTSNAQYAANLFRTGAATLYSNARLYEIGLYNGRVTDSIVRGLAERIEYEYSVTP